MFRLIRPRSRHTALISKTSARHRSNEHQSGERKLRWTASIYQIDANDQFLTSNDYKPLVVAYNNGAPVMFSDVARVVDDVENQSWRRG